MSPQGISGPPIDRINRIEGIVQQVVRKLPQQNPLNFFLHNNLLAAFEVEPFWQGVRQAAALYGGRPVKDITWYFSKWNGGKIAEAALDDSLQRLVVRLKGAEDAKELGLFLKPLMTLGPRSPLENLLWRSGHSSPFLTGCLKRATDQPQAVEWPLEVFEWLCRLLETHLDQGLAPWHPEPMGLLALALDFLHPLQILRKSWEKDLYQRLKPLIKDPIQSPKGYLEQTIQNSQLNDQSWETIFLKLCFSLRGWSGMVAKTQTEPAFFTKVPPSDVVELIVLLQILGEILGISFAEDLEPPLSQSQSQWLENQSWTTLKPQRAQMLRTMDPVVTAMVWHEAFELTHYGALVQKFQQPCTQLNSQKSSAGDTGSPDYQVLVCMDDRQESLRRHLEDAVPNVVTYGVLGHFGIDMSVVPAHHPRPRQHCPPVMKPRRSLIEERPGGEGGVRGPLIQKFSARHFHSSKTAWGGAASSLILGNAALMPLFLKFVTPQLLHRVHFKWSKQIMKKPNLKRPALRLDRYEHRVYGPCGYDHAEQAEIVASLLSQSGLRRGPFADLIIAMGHESTGTNNPYIQAYGCGACSGNSGSPNSRAFAKMLNDPLTRLELTKLGILLPNDTRCVAAVHDTSREMIETFEDEAELAPRHLQKLTQLKGFFLKALEQNARERAPLLKIKQSENILKKMADRPLDLAQIRPEYGHSRTHFAFFGKRRTTQNRTLERRCFLVSYDEDQDEGGQTLRELLHGALPVVANITLDYFFSSLDSRGFGSSNKVPLNVSAMLGVIQGSRGDLQVGMAEQMVEIHEPIRAFALIEAPQDWILKAIKSHKRLTHLVDNQWLRVGHFDSRTQKVSHLEGDLWRDFEGSQSYPDFSSLYGNDLKTNKDPKRVF